MSKLNRLHRALRSLKRRRRGFRWATAYSGMLSVLLWTLVALFLLDWWFQLDRVERVVAMLPAAVLLALGFYFLSRPWLGYRESELDMALAVEKRHHIDSDLVAALQFESPEAPRWGSVELEQAVIDRVATISPQMKAAEGFSYRPLAWRSGALMLSVLLVTAGAARYPDYAAAFLSRLLLGSGRYPTSTRIEAIVINGRPVELHALRPAAAKIAYGKPLHLEVTCSGALPYEGRAAMTTVRTRDTKDLKLTAVKGRRGVYETNLSQLFDPMVYRLYLGDTWTEPGRLDVIPLPAVDVEMEVTPPRYAGAKAETFRSLRQVSVIEGSRVVLRIVSDKPLRRADLALDGRRYATARETPPGAQSSGAQDGVERWAPAAGPTPLDSVEAQVRYEVQVVDMDGLSLESPLKGAISIKADRTPEVRASAVTLLALPTARPSIAVAASDDYGVARLRLVPELVRNGRAEPAGEIVVYDLPKSRPAEKNVQGKFYVSFAPWKLAKGDQVRVTVMADDYRGDRPGKSTGAGPIVFQITDRDGIAAARKEALGELHPQVQTLKKDQDQVGGNP